MNGRDKRRAKAARNAARGVKPACPACGEAVGNSHLTYEALGEPRQFSCGNAPELMLSAFPPYSKLFLEHPMAHRMVDPKIEAQFFEKYMSIDGYNPFRK